MIRTVKADAKGRISIRGIEGGRQYLVTSQNGGWWVIPARELRPRKKRREWAGSAMTLAQHLQGLAESGLCIEQAENAKEPVGPCRF